MRWLSGLMRISIQIRENDRAMTISTSPATGLPRNVHQLYSTANGVASAVECQDFGWARLEIDVTSGTPTGTFTIQTRIAESLDWKTQAFIPLSVSGQGTFQTSITSFADSAYDIPLRGAVQIRAQHTGTTGTFSAHIALDGAGY